MSGILKGIIGNAWKELPLWVKVAAAGTAGVGVVGGAVGLGVGANAKIHETNRQDAVVNQSVDEKKQRTAMEINATDRALTASEQGKLPEAYSMTDTLKSFQKLELNDVLDASTAVRTTTSNAWSQADGTRQAPTSYNQSKSIDAQQKVELNNTDQQAHVMTTNAKLEAGVMNHGAELQAGVQTTGINAEKTAMLDSNAAQLNAQNNMVAAQVVGTTGRDVNGYTLADGQRGVYTLGPSQTLLNGAASGTTPGIPPGLNPNAQPGLGPTQVGSYLQQYQYNGAPVLPGQPMPYIPGAIPPFTPSTGV